MSGDELAKLRSLIARELESPADPDAFRRALDDAFPDLRPALRLAAIKDEEHRTTFYVKSERVWFRRFGFRIMRPLFVVAILAAVGFSLQRAIDPTLALGCFLAGAFSFYAALQFFAFRWSKADQTRLDEARERYRMRLQRLRDGFDEGA